ncbi:MAG: hypothetical protein K2K93_12130 [Muribaculaceae bacterium]|nr:hypothetical protein [Muribaculaceae bacterium]
MAELWETDEYKVEQMYKNKSLDVIIDDFFSVLLRFYHVPFDLMKPHYLKDPERMTELELIENNPWHNVAAKYKGNSFLLSDAETFVCEEDLQMINEFNDSVKKEEYKYKLNLPVYPWYGNPLKAKVIVLSQNPAWNPKQDEIVKDMLIENSPSLRGFTDHLRNMLDFKCVGFLPTSKAIEGISPRDLANKHMSFYWQNRLKGAFVNDDTCLSLDDIIDKFAIIQYVGYSSQKFKPFKKGTMLPSQRYTRQLIEYILRHHKDTVFIVPRNVKRWQDFLGDLWSVFSYRFIVGIHYRSQSLKTMSEIDRNKVINAFRQPMM